MDSIVYIAEFEIRQVQRDINRRAMVFVLGPLLGANRNPGPLRAGQLVQFDRGDWEVPLALVDERRVTVWEIGWIDLPRVPELPEDWQPQLLTRPAQLLTPGLERWRG